MAIIAKKQDVTLMIDMSVKTLTKYLVGIWKGNTVGNYYKKNTGQSKKWCSVCSCSWWVFVQFWSLLYNSGLSISIEEGSGNNKNCQADGVAFKPGLIQ